MSKSDKKKAKKGYKHSNQVNDMGFCTMVPSQKKKEFDLINIEDGAIIMTDSLKKVSEVMYKRNKKAKKQFNLMKEELDRLHTRCEDLSEAVVTSMPKFTTMVNNMEIMYEGASTPETEEKVVD